MGTADAAAQYMLHHPKTCTPSLDGGAAQWWLQKGCGDGVKLAKQGRET